MAKKQSEHNLTGAFDLFPKSYDIVKSNLGVFLLVYALPALLSIRSENHRELGSKGQWFSDGGMHLSGIPIYAIVSIVSVALIIIVAIVIVSVFIQAMTYVLELESAKGKKPTVSHLIEVAKNTGFGSLVCQSPPGL